METDVELSDKDRQVAVITELATMPDPRSYRFPFQPTSRDPSRRPHQKAYFPAPTGSLYQLPASTPLLSPNTDPHPSRVSDTGRTDYRTKAPPDWYRAPEAEQSELSANGGTRHTIQQPQVQGNPPIPNVILARSHEPRHSVAEQIARFDQESLDAPGSSPHTHQMLSKAPLQGWNRAPDQHTRIKHGPSGSPCEPYPERPVSRRSNRRPLSTAGSDDSASCLPAESRRGLSVTEQGAHIQLPLPRDYRRRSPLSDRERSLRSTMGSSMDRQPQAGPMPSRHARDQPTPSNGRDIPQARTFVGSSMRPLIKMVATDDPLTAHGSGSSSSASSAALENYEPRSEPKKHRSPHPGTVDTRVPKSRKESISRGSPPSIYVVPADTPSPSLGVTKVQPPASRVDGRFTVRPATGTSKATSRSAPKQSHDEHSRQYVPSQRSEGSYRRSNEPSQNRHGSPARLDPDHRGLERSLGPLKLPRERSALSGLGRIGSKGSLREHAQAPDLGSDGEDSQSTSGYFTEYDDDRTSDYSDGSFDEWTAAPSQTPRMHIPQHASGDPRSQQSRPVADERHPAAGYATSRPDPRLDNKISKPFPGRPPQPRPVDSAATENESEKRGRRSRSRMPGGFPGGA